MCIIQRSSNLLLVWLKQILVLIPHSAFSWPTQLTWVNSGNLGSRWGVAINKSNTRPHFNSWLKWPCDVMSLDIGFKLKSESFQSSQPNFSVNHPFISISIAPIHDVIGGLFAKLFFCLHISQSTNWSFLPQPLFKSVGDSWERNASCNPCKSRNAPIWKTSLSWVWNRISFKSH